MFLLKNPWTPIRVKSVYYLAKFKYSCGQFVFFSRVDNALLLGGFIEFLVNHFDLLPECRDIIIKALNRNGVRSRFYRGAYREKYERRN